MSTIPKDSLVLVTGVSGYIASQTALQLLEAGYRVRGTVRSEQKAEWLYKLFDEKYGKGKFEAFVVPDMNADNAFDEAVKGVAGICHLASIMSFSDKPDEVIPPTVKGALNIMTAATKEPGIKSVVYCSSSTAALLPKPNEVIKVEKGTWNEETVRIASEPNPDAFSVYGASKTQAEKAIWETVKQTKPPFQVAAVLPNCNLGPIIQPGGEKSSSTASVVMKLYEGDSSPFNMFPPQWFVDVRDTARLHVIALIDPACNGERIFAFTAPFTWSDVLAELRKLFPDKTFPEDQDKGKDLSQIPNQEAEELLRKHYGRGFFSLEESIEANTATVR